jgi:hypothetical protein
VQNLNRRHIYKILFILFFEPFFVRLASKFSKSTNMTKKFFFVLIKKIVKNAGFHADFKSVEKVVKKCTKKVLSKTSLMNMSKSENSAFFCVHFFKLFQRFRNHREILHF